MLERNAKYLGGFLKRSTFILVLLIFLPFSTVAKMPDGATVVTDFSLERYLGTWYQVTATYSMRDDGGVRVLNRGYKEKKSKWSDAEGKAYFVEEPDIGRLKVSFFGPFYGAYNIIALEPENYSYALVIGNNTKYMWILAREPALEPAMLENVLDKAQKLGFATDELIYPQKQGMSN